MPFNIIAAFDTAGAIAFLIALIISIKVYKKTKEISYYWLIFSISLFFAFLWASAIALEWIGFYPIVMDELEQILLGIVAVLFAMISVETLVSPVKSSQ